LPSSSSQGSPPRRTAGTEGWCSRVSIDDIDSSYWLEDAAIAFPKRRHQGRVDVAIVGAGVTGCSCALTLAEGGLRVRVHEAREVATGASGRNGGFALRGGAPPYDVARSKLGPKRAVPLWRLSERALERLADLAGDAFRLTGSLRLAADQDEARSLRAEYDALRSDGFEAEWRPELNGPLAGRFHGALFHPTDGSLQPARWVRRLALRAADAGAEIREHDQIGDIDELEADAVVIATDGYTHGLLESLDRAVRPTRGQVLVTEPLDERLFSCPHSARQGYDYWRQTEEGRVVLGGRRDYALEPEWTSEEGTTPEIQEQLEGFLRELVGSAPRITHRWSGIFGMTEDLLPLAGRVRGRDGIWVACGYSGHGNVLGLACGDLVAQALLGWNPPELALFDPVRVL
jgi:gamma-glutamylputrescine oxidase